MFSSGSKLGTIQVPTCRRFSSGMPPQVSSPGSPGLGIVRVRQSSLPVFPSCAVMMQPLGVALYSQPRPEMILPLAMIGPEVSCAESSR